MLICKVVLKLWSGTERKINNKESHSITDRRKHRIAIYINFVLFCYILKQKSKNMGTWLIFWFLILVLIVIKWKENYHPILLSTYSYRKSKFRMPLKQKIQWSSLDKRQSDLDIIYTSGFVGCVATIIPYIYIILKTLIVTCSTKKIYLWNVLRIIK